MSNLEQRLFILEESKKRMETLTQGDQVSNICAGDLGRYLTFIDYVIKKKKNRYGITHREYSAKCRFSNGRTGLFGIEVIHKGNLSKEKCQELFEPVWQATYG